jgi:glycosyltransferase involved in cell wall biosynthesis
MTLGPLKISAVTITLNRRDMLLQAIESVLAQRYPNFEHVVVDGGSTDGTVELLRSYPHLKWISEPDQGQAEAMNKGLRLMTGDVFAWLNSDDTYLPGAFYTVNKYFTSSPDTALICGTCNLVDAELRLIGKTNYHRFDLSRLMMGYNNVNTPAVFVRKDALDACGRFDTSLRATYDLDMWIRIAQRFAVKAVPETLSNYRLHPGSGFLSPATRNHGEKAKIFARYAGQLGWFDQTVRGAYFALRHRLYDIFKFGRLTRHMSNR